MGWGVTGLFPIFATIPSASDMQMEVSLCGTKTQQGVETSLPVEGGSELPTNSTLGKLNSVNTRATDTIVHISLPYTGGQGWGNWSYSKPLLLLQCHQADHQGHVCPHRAQKSPGKVQPPVASAAKSRHKTVRLKMEQGAPLKPEGERKQAGQHQRNNFKSTPCPAGTAAALPRATCLLPK